MSETKPSRMQQIKDALKKVAGDQAGRLEQLYAQAAKYEGQAVAQVTATVDEVARLSKDTFSYYGQLSAEWRKLTLEAAKKTTERFTSQA